MEHFLVHDPDPFISPVSSSNTPPTVHTTDTAGITLHDGDDNDDDDAPEMRIPHNQPHKHGLTKEEFDDVVNSLLEYLEEAEIASPESGCEEYEYYSPENAERELHYGPWSPGSPLYLAHGGSEDEGNLSEAETLEVDEAYDRASLELVRTSCRIPIRAGLPEGDDACPYQFGFEGEGSHSE